MAHEQQRIGIRAYLLPLHLDDGRPVASCLFNQNQVVEVLAPRPVQPIPCSPAYLKGVLAYHGELLPVIDLDLLCGRRPSGQLARALQLMVVRTGMLDPGTNLPLKAVIASSVRIQITKIAGHELIDGFMPQEAPSVLSRSGLLRGYFERHSHSIALLDLSPVVLGVVGQSAEERCH